MNINEIKSKKQVFELDKFEEYSPSKESQKTLEIKNPKQEQHTKSSITKLIQEVLDKSHHVSGEQSP